MAERNPSNENEAGRFVAAVIEDANHERLKVSQPALLKLHALRRQVLDLSVKMTGRKRLELARAYEAKRTRIAQALAKIELDALERIEAYHSGYSSTCENKATRIEGPMISGAFVAIALPRPLGQQQSGFD